MSRYLRKYNKKYAKRHKGKYLDLSKTNVNVSKKSKAAKAYDKLADITKKVKKSGPAISKGARAVKGYIQGTNDGLDSVLGIKKRDPDFGLVTRLPKGYKIVRKRRRRR